MNQNIINNNQHLIEMIEVVEKEINLNQIVNIIMTEFRIKTEEYTKKFFKISKKDFGNKQINQQKRIEFIKEFVYPKWSSIVEDKNEDMASLPLILNESVYLSYIFGIFILIHSKEVSENINTLLKGILAEIILKSVISIKKQ